MHRHDDKHTSTTIKNPLSSQNINKNTNTNNEQPDKHKNGGQTPAHFQKRMDDDREKKNERERTKIKNSFCTPGYSIPEDVSVQTVNELKDALKEVNNMIQELPLKIETHSIRVRQKELFDKQKDIEKMIETFNRKVG